MTNRCVCTLCIRGIRYIENQCSVQERENIMSNYLSYHKDIKPLFRQKDQEDMLSYGGFDLWKYEDVRDRAQDILDRLIGQIGDVMPCDGRWPEEQIKLFEQWIKDNMQP